MKIVGIAVFFRSRPWSLSSSSSSSRLSRHLLGRIFSKFRNDFSIQPFRTLNGLVSFSVNTEENQLNLKCAHRVLFVRHECLFVKIINIWRPDHFLQHDASEYIYIRPARAWSSWCSFFHFVFGLHCVRNFEENVVHIVVFLAEYLTLARLQFRRTQWPHNTRTHTPREIGAGSQIRKKETQIRGTNYTNVLHE